MKKKFIGLYIALGFVIFSVLFYLLGLWEGLEYKTFDLRFQIRGQAIPANDIVIVRIDQDSIDKIGRWPWDRSVHGRIIDSLTYYGVKIIAFDVFFTERQKKEGEDSALIDATRRSKRVIHELVFEVEGAEVVRLNLPFPGLSKYALDVTSPNFWPELDGVLRKVPTIVEYKGKKYPHFSVSVASKYLKIPQEEIISKLAIDWNNEMTVNYCGGYGTFPYVSYNAVMERKLSKEVKKLIKDKIILIGFDAAGLGDKVVTPFPPIMPGVEVLANAIDTILKNNSIVPPKKYQTVISTIIFGIILGFLIPKFSAWKSTAMTFGIVAVYLILVQLSFSIKNLWIEIVPNLFVIFGSFVSVTLYRFMTEEKEKRWIKKAFSQYVSPTVINEIMQNPDALALGGQRKTLTVLFSDIRGFTTMSEGLTPEGVVSILNEYLTKMAEVVFKYEGTLDKFIGDAVMSFWGAPVPQPDHPKRAVMCAITMMEELRILQDKWRKEGRHVIDIGIGVNTGEMVVGNMGSIERMDYTVIGDNVNLAARLEGLNKEFKSHIIISESTYEIVKEFIQTKPLGGAKVKGKEKAVNIYEVLGKKEG